MIIFSYKAVVNYHVKLIREGNRRESGHMAMYMHACSLLLCMRLACKTTMGQRTQVIESCELY